MNMETALQTSPAKRTRATVLKDKVKVRLALDSAGPLIAEVLKENNIEIPGASWDHVFPNWLVATVGDDVIGCIQVMPAKPVGWLEFLFTKKSAPYKFRVIAFRKLLEQGAGTLQMAGCSYVLGTVEPGNKAFMDILAKYQAINVGRVNLMAWRTPRIQ